MKREELRTVKYGDNTGHYHGLFQKSELVEQGITFSIVAIVETKAGVLEEVPYKDIVFTDTEEYRLSRIDFDVDKALEIIKRNLDGGTCNKFICRVRTASDYDLLLEGLASLCITGLETIHIPSSINSQNILLRNLEDEPKKYLVVVDRDTHVIATIVHRCLCLNTVD